MPLLFQVCVAWSVPTTRELSSESKIDQKRTPSSFLIGKNHTPDKPMARMLPLCKARILEQSPRRKFPGGKESTSRGYWFCLLSVLALWFLLSPQAPKSDTSLPPVRAFGTLTGLTVRTILEGGAIVFILLMKKLRFRNVKEIAQENAASKCQSQDNEPEM